MKISREIQSLIESDLLKMAKPDMAELVQAQRDATRQAVLEMGEEAKRALMWHRFNGPLPTQEPLLLLPAPDDLLEVSEPVDPPDPGGPSPSPGVERGERDTPADLARRELEQPARGKKPTINRQRDVGEPGARVWQPEPDAREIAEWSAEVERADSPFKIFRR